MSSVLCVPWIAVLVAMAVLAMANVAAVLAAKTIASMQQENAFARNAGDAENGVPHYSIVRFAI